MLEKRHYLRAEKRMTWFWQEFDPPNSRDTFVYQSGNVCYKPYIFSKTKSQHEDEKVDDNEGDMMVGIDDRPSQGMRWWRLTTYLHEVFELLGIWEKKQVQEKIFVKQIVPFAINLQKIIFMINTGLQLTVKLKIF